MGPGQFRITAESGAATVSQEVDLVLQEDAQLAIIIPTPAATETPTPSPTPSPTPEPTETPQPPPTITPPAPAAEAESGWLIRLSELRALLGVLMGLLAVGGLALLMNRRLPPALPLRQQVGRLLWGLAGGLLVYNYYALGMPGATLFAALGSLAGLLLVLAGGIGGLLLYRR
jgi:hypothetical protein